MNTKPLIIERVFNAPIDKVWKIITDKDLIKKWFVDIPDFEPTVGHKFQFWGEKEDRKYLHFCEVTDVIHEKKLRYSWRYDGYPGNSFVTYELFEEDGKTRLKLTHEGLESFGTENPDLAKDNFGEGWTYIIHTLLREFVEEGKVNV